VIQDLPCRGHIKIKALTVCKTDRLSEYYFKGTIKSIRYLHEISTSIQLLNEFIGDGTMPLTASKYPEEIGFIQTLQQLFKLT